MAKKNYWTSKAGKAAIQQAAATDAAGAMRVGPASQNSRGFVGALPSRAPAMMVDPASIPGRSPFTAVPAVIQNKLVSQGPSTGFGSFRGGTSMGVGVDPRSSPMTRGTNIRRV